MHSNPEPGSIWRHYSGREYTVLAVTDEHPGHPPAVIYQGENGKYWSRSLAGWHLKMTFVSGPKLPEPPPTAAGCVIAAFFIMAGAILGYIIASIQFASQIAR